MSNEVDKLLSEIEALKDRLANIEAKMQQVDLDGVNTQIIADFLQNFVERFHKLEVGEKKLLVQSIVKRIEVYNKNKVRLQMTLPILPENERCESKITSLDKDDSSFASSFGLAVPRE